VVIRKTAIVGGPGHIVLRKGKRVLITYPKQVSDPLSEVLIKMAAEIHELREKFQEPTHERRSPEPEIDFDQRYQTFSDGAGV